MEEELSIRGPGWDLFATVSGTGPPILLLHGQLGTHKVVRRLVSDLADSRTLITPDIRGRGSSVCPDSSLHSWGQYAEDVIMFLDRLSIERAAIGGISLGAGIALSVALRSPNRVSALVLHSNVYAGQMIGWLPSQRKLQERVLETAREIADKGFDALESRAPEGADREAWMAKWRRHDARSISAALLGLGFEHPFGDVEDLHQISSPTIVVPGNDALHPSEVSDLYIKSIPRAEKRDSHLLESDWKNL